MAIVGAGALGTVFAAAAERAGLDTVMCARSRVPALVLERDDGAHTLDVPVVDDPSAAGPAGWVLVTTKAQDTAATGPWLKRLCGRETVVVVVQNGVEHRANAEPLAGPATVLPALAYIAAERVAPGRVVHRRGSRVVVEAGPAGVAFAEQWAPAGLDVVLEPDFRTAAWRKLLSNVAANPITALTSRRMEVLREPKVRGLASTLLAETVAVGIAEGARLGPGDVDETLAFYDGFAESDGTSMLYDRLAGRPLEHESINGVVVRLGRRHGVPTPANEALCALLGAVG